MAFLRATGRYRTIEIVRREAVRREQLIPIEGHEGQRIRLRNNMTGAIATALSVAPVLLSAETEASGITRVRSRLGLLSPLLREIVVRYYFDNDAVESHERRLAIIADLHITPKKFDLAKNRALLQLKHLLS